MAKESPKSQQSVTNLIRAEAKKQGVDPELAVKIATVESGLNPSAKNPRSTAAGLFQLIDQTRKELGGNPKKRFDPLENVRLGVKLIKQNQGELMGSLGREPSAHELYMAHMFGASGAATLIQSNPKMSVKQAVSQFSKPEIADRIVRDNRLSGTVGDMMSGFQQKFGKKPPQSIEEISSPVKKFSKGGEAEKKFAKDDLEALVKQAASYSKEDSEALVKRKYDNLSKDALVTLPINDAEGKPLRLPASQVEPFLRSMNLFVGSAEMTDRPMQGGQAGQGSQGMDTGVAPITYGDVVFGKASYDVPVGEGSVRLGAAGAYTKPINQEGVANIGEYEASYANKGRRLGAAYNPNIEAARFFYEQPLGDKGMAGIGYMPQQGTLPSDQLNFFVRQNFSKGGEAFAAPAVVVTPEKRPSGMMMDLKRKEFTEPLKTDSRNMLDRLLAGRKQATEDLGGIAADIAAGTLNPIYGVASSAADFEIARREGDKLGMALSGVGMVPVAGPLLKGLGMAAVPLAGIVKQKGGNWLSMAKDFQSSTEPGVRDISGQLASLKSPTIAGQPPAERIPMVEELLRNDPDLNPELQVRVQRNLDQLKRDAALDKWVDSNLTNYFKKQMATPEDPLRALAEEGRIPLDPEDIAETRRLRERMKQYTPESFPEPVFDVRNREGMAGTEPGRVFETFTDSLIKGDSAGDLLRRAEGSSRYAQKIVQDNPWLTKVDPSTEVYSLRETPASIFAQRGADETTGPSLTQSFNLQHLTDVLRTDMAEGRLNPERLSKMSVADAYKRMFEFDDEMVKAAKKAELERTAALMKSEPVLQYETGFRWVKLPDPESDETSMRLVKDIGCRGGWCTQHDENALRYGAASRGNELFVLLDEGGKAHIQIQTQKVPFDSFERERAINQYVDTLNQDPGRLSNFVNEYRSRIGIPAEDLSRVFRIALDNDTQKVVDEFINKGKPVPEDTRLPRDFVDFLTERKQVLDATSDIKQMKPWNNTWEGQFVRDELAKNPQYKQQIRPYIDDFVANGNWRDVNDLSNSNLINVGLMPTQEGAFRRSYRRISYPSLSGAFDALSDAYRDQPEVLGRVFRVTPEQARASIVDNDQLLQAYIRGRDVIENSPTLMTQEAFNADPSLKPTLDFVQKVDELTQSLRPPRKMADGGEVKDTWCLSFLCRKR